MNTCKCCEAPEDNFVLCDRCASEARVDATEITIAIARYTLKYGIGFKKDERLRVELELKYNAGR